MKKLNLKSFKKVTLPLILCLICLPILAAEGDAWTKENLMKISKRSFKPLTRISPLGFSMLSFEGKIPVNCLNGSSFQLERQDVVAIYLNPSCDQGNIQEYSNQEMVEINWDEIRKPDNNDFRKIRGSIDGKDEYDHLSNFDFLDQSFFGEVIGYSDEEILPQSLDFYMDHTYESITLTDEEVEAGKHEDHEAWLKFQARRSQNFDNIVYQIIVSMNNGSNKISFGSVKKALLNPVRKEARQWARNKARGYGHELFEGATDYMQGSAIGEYFSFFSEDEDRDVIDLGFENQIVDFSRPSHSKTEKGTYGKGYCLRKSDGKKYSDPEVKCIDRGETCPLGESMSYRDLSQPMCEDVQYARGKGFVAHVSGKWIPYRKPEKELISAPKLGFDVGVEVKVDHVVLENELGIKLSGSDKDHIKYEFEYEYCHENMGVGIGSYEKESCSQSHKIKLGVQSVLYDSEATVNLSGEFLADRENGAESHGAIMLRFSKPLYGMFHLFSLD